jgi:integration host factor subunit alpha
MTLTRADIISEIQDKLGFTKRQSTELTEQITEIIKSTLAKGGDVLISGFGKFSVKD